MEMAALAQGHQVALPVIPRVVVQMGRRQHRPRQANFGHVEQVGFGSLRPDQLDLSRTSAIGVKHLKDFLTFALHGARAFAMVATGPLTVSAWRALTRARSTDSEYVQSRERLFEGMRRAGIPEQ